MPAFFQTLFVLVALLVLHYSEFLVLSQRPGGDLKALVHEWNTCKLISKNGLAKETIENHWQGYNKTYCLSVINDYRVPLLMAKEKNKKTSYEVALLFLISNFTLTLFILLESLFSALVHNFTKRISSFIVSDGPEATGRQNAVATSLELERYISEKKKLAILNFVSSVIPIYYLILTWPYFETYLLFLLLSLAINAIFTNLIVFSYQNLYPLKFSHSTSDHFWFFVLQNLTSYSESFRNWCYFFAILRFFYPNLF